jgi:hypothetical protein
MIAYQTQEHLATVDFPLLAIGILTVELIFSSKTLNLITAHSSHWLTVSISNLSTQSAGFTFRVRPPGREDVVILLFIPR